MPALFPCCIPSVPEGQAFPQASAPSALPLWTAPQGQSRSQQADHNLGAPSGAAEEQVGGGLGGLGRRGEGRVSALAPHAEREPGSLWERGAKGLGMIIEKEFHLFIHFFFFSLPLF